ncbi:C40 family peptidase [Alkalibacillus salilacus]|uniref:Cell wall-associated NlpC family hydrolase n=1 Tax=Alkalibacillus salilacus TaxID=284582 RepID=A0ABT9VIE3_9BACI|nr:NlpC/P60 family protein [Alkalibacillus salilacus]MDQ0160684.1 cell wall-associated NlpC family hydrolase [Alkalibacillus salilacus]
MVNATPTKKMILGAIAGNLALASPFAFYSPVHASETASIQSTPLSYGDHGEAVLTLHRKLKTIEYYPKKETAQYNALTEYAVKQFQTDHHLDANGELNQETANMLDQVFYDHYITSITDVAEEIKFGEQSKRVERLQNALKALRLYDEEVDSVAGPNTKEALEKFNQFREDKLDLSQLEPPTIVHREETQQVSHMSKSQSNTKQKSETVQTQSNRSVTSTARSLVGTPYRWGGTSRSGFDCSGFLQYVYGQQGSYLPRTVSDIWNATTPASKPSVGNLVFFETYQPGPSHAGIYIGNNQFIHAGTSSGVTISNLSDSYWQQRYLGARIVH